MIQFIQQNWAVMLLGVLPLAEVVTRLTPTKKDDTALDFVKKFIDVFVPNLKKGGGTH